ncbi:hypothetical protein [Streptomyces sp. NBC_01304]|uniref:hypothetical protein n=1 Tax=Streptomyces sp. NBC_01304 TaxID=2903818 RepID=UPI002E0E4DBA|nr:hypothetical protein OG430_48345 [Streptomyces sp. NBC_01304]
MTAYSPLAQLASNSFTATPTSRQRSWMLAALRDRALILPETVNSRSLVLMRSREWIEPVPAEQGPHKFRLTFLGRFALLSVPKAHALLSAQSPADRHPGRLTFNASAMTLKPLISERLVVMLDRHGEQRAGREEHPYITNLGRRIVELPEADETEAGQYLTDAFAEAQIPVSVERDNDGNTRVVYRRDGVVAQFYREVWNPDGYTHSVRHPAWMHTKPWTALVTYGTDGAVEKNLLNHLGLPTESAQMATSFAAWLRDRDDDAFEA